MTHTDAATLVQEADLGGREPSGLAARVIALTCLAWSLLQVWNASPLPFALNVLVLNSTQMRSLHLAFGIFLAFCVYPFGRRSPRSHIPWHEWVLAAIAAFCSAYLFIFYREIAERPGQPTPMDYAAAVVGMVLLLEATRRVLGPPLAVIAILMLVYAFAGPHMPDVVAHKGVSLTKAVSHYWLTTEGVFGVALGVSASYIFLFVLFGSLLEKAGAGNYFIQIAFALLGHMRGGPAKAAVVSSGLMGMISGSSVANVATCGTFTIPLMKRVGYSAEKAGAIEVAAGVDGQIMPPVMGAAAFLMAEYVGVPYSEIVKNAFLPAIISYVALFYIVHLEACKSGIHGVPHAGASSGWRRLAGVLMTIAGIVVVGNVVYYALGWLRPLLGPAATWFILAVLAVSYIAIVRRVAREPDLAADDPGAQLLTLPPVKATLLGGLHYLLPVVVLVWALLVEELSPGLSAFYATVFLMVILVTQKPLLAYFRARPVGLAIVREGIGDFIQGLEHGARNMIGIALATAAAGIIVGTVSVTGLGLVMTEFVETVSAGNLIAMLVLVAVICLVLGMGMPTTANYIVVSTLMAPVVVELGAQAGLVVPLVAVHMFVFYFGLMADVTPPVGLASFAAAAISRADPIRTGIVAFWYSSRTAILPFMFVFNPNLLMIDIASWWNVLLVIAAAVVAMLTFAAATQGWFMTRSRWYESVLLLLATLTLLRPGFWLDRVMPQFEMRPPQQVESIAAATEPGHALRLRIEGTTLEGRDVNKTVLLPLGSGQTAAQKMAASGLRVMALGDQLQVMSVGLNSAAAKAGFEQGFTITGIETATDRPAKEWMFVPAGLLIVAIMLVQLRRERRAALAGVAA
ncbi:MAG TPA: TRAP transporter permease [Rubrivivax sp.]|nr:TRAP transporter permease [Rubrivivax sp.]